MNALVLAALIVCAQDDAKVFVKDGRAPAVYYGWSPVLDYFGNIRKGVWALRSDGTLFWGCPRDSFEDFARRALTAEEKQSCSTYAIDGSKFHFTFKDGRASTGEIEFHPDGSIKVIKANILRYSPVRHGIPFELTGYWENNISFTGGSMTTSVNSHFSFFKGGLFVFETVHGSIGRAVQERTFEHRSGDSIIQETVRSEVTKAYGAGSASQMGKYRVTGSAIHFEYEDGRRESRYIGTIPGLTGEQLILIGGSLYTGTPGKFAGGPAADKAPAAPAAPAPIKCPEFELQAPAGWIVREQEQDAGKLHFLIPPDVSRSDPFAVILVGSVVDKTTKPSHPDLPKVLEGLASGLANGATVKPSGAATLFSNGGADALRVAFTATDGDRTFGIEVTYVIRDGNVLIALALGSEAAMKRHGEEARKTIALARIAAAAPPALEKLSGPGFELDMPKGWKATETESEGQKVTTLVPPGADITSEYGAFFVTTPAEKVKTATEKDGIEQLRAVIKELASAAEPQGEPETLKADGEPAVLVRYAVRNAEGAVVALVHGLMVVKHGKAVVLIVLGTDKQVAAHAAAVRAGFQSLRVKK